jgi:hypothetical protein
VLKLRIPKPITQRPHRIEIKANGNEPPAESSAAGPSTTTESSAPQHAGAGA